jgi:hypothetical protein
LQDGTDAENGYREEHASSTAEHITRGGSEKGSKSGTDAKNSDDEGRVFGANVVVDSSIVTCSKLLLELIHGKNTVDCPRGENQLAVDFECSHESKRRTREQNTR